MCCVLRRSMDLLLHPQQLLSIQMHSGTLLDQQNEDGRIPLLFQWLLLSSILNLYLLQTPTIRIQDQMLSKIILVKFIYFLSWNQRSFSIYYEALFEL